MIVDHPQDTVAEFGNRSQSMAKFGIGRVRFHSRRPLDRVLHPGEANPSLTDDDSGVL